MTLIECFDRSVIKNIAGCLQLQPQKLIFLGDREQMRLPVQRCRELLDRRGINTQVLSRHIPMDDPDGAISVLARIVEEQADCVIDVSGGDERLLMAVGAVLAGLDEQKRQHVSVEKFDLLTQEALSVWDLITLHGGTIYPGTDQPDSRYGPKDLQRLWELVCRDPKSWNRKLSLLSEFESRADSKTQVYLPLNRIRSGIQNYPEKLPLVRDLLEDFHRQGVIRDSSSQNALSYTYTSPLMRWCTQKAGNALEVKVLLEARALREQGKPYFDDCQMSVHIDWDGDTFAPEDRIPETRNEIDLILTRGLTPLFISCKNGNICDDELYKLHTVAERFGGPYARKMLIATDLDRGSRAADLSFSQRARDMGIYLITDAAKLSANGWKEIFKAACETGCPL